MVVGNAADEGEDSERDENGGIRAADDKVGREDVAAWEFVLLNGVKKGEE